MKKYILIGTILLSMLLFAACGEEKPLADRVIENLENCMGARQVTEEEYEELKRNNGLFPMDFMRFLQQENVYLIFKEEDLEIVNIDLSYYVKEEVEVKNALIFKYNNDIDNTNTHTTAFLYEFTSDEDADKFMEYIDEVREDYFILVKENKIAQGIYPSDRKLGIEEGENYVYQVVSSEMNGKSIDSIYLYKLDRQVMEVHYNGYEDNVLYPKYEKFLKKMKFEGLNDIELEYAEPQS